MVLDQAKSLLDDAVEKTKDAAKATAEATEEENEEELESEYEKKMEELQEQYNKKLVLSIFSKLDDQEWKDAEKLAREEGNLDNEGWNTLIEKYISIRLKQGQTKLAIIRYQLKQAENFISQAESAKEMSIFESLLKQTISRYKKIEQDEILNAQKHIGAAEQASKRYKDALKSHKIFAMEHEKVNQLDRDVEEAEKDLKELISMVES